MRGATPPRPKTLLSAFPIDPIDPIDPMNSILISDLPADERPRERFERLGASALSVPELLAILLRTGVRGCSAMSVATQLLEHFDGNLARLASAPLGEICRLHGVGQTKAVTLGAAFELARRLQQAALPHRMMASTPEAIVAYLRTRIRQTDQEEFHVLLLDAKNQILADECVTVGLMDRALVHAREVFRTAIRIGCMRVVLAHNHPSGDPRPSRMDETLTKTLVASGELLDIAVLDHIILGRVDADPRHEGFFSFKRSGKL